MCRTTILVALASLLACAGCGREEAATPGPGGDDGTPVIYTTFYPTTYFAERIGGELVEVVCPCPEDEDPIMWMPDTGAITAYQQADLIVINGAGFEQWVDKVALPAGRLVNTARPFEADLLEYEDAVVHAHGPSGEHAHEGLDGHTWMDPIQARTQAEAIKDALVERYPQWAERFEANYQALAGDLGALNASLQELAEGYQQQPLLCSHPAYNYIARRYGWNIRNLDLDPETVPSDETLLKIEKVLAEHRAQYLIWESFPAPEVAAVMRNRFKLVNLELSPCELLSSAEQAQGVDYLSVMRRNVGNIEPALTGQ